MPWTYLQILTYSDLPYPDGVQGRAYALATLLLVASFLALILAYFGLRARRRGSGSALEDLADYG